MGKVVRVGLNGFGRIGRCFTRIACDNSNIEIAAVNTSRSTPEILSYLLRYDSIYRTFEKNIAHASTSITIDNKSITCFNYKNPQDIPWHTQDVDVVVDCTGVFETRQELAKHIGASVKKVVLTSPSNDKTIPHIVLGVNDKDFPFEKADIISNASCTTNCAAIMFKVLHDSFTIKSGYITTIHSYTSSQQLLDNSGHDFTRSRAAPLSIIPSTTGAADAIVRVIPKLEGLIDGTSIRVPVPVVSYSDISCIVEKNPTTDQINQSFKNRAEGDLHRYLAYEDEQLVSSDYIGSPYSCIFDANYTAVMPNNLMKIFGWYDNEWGYSSRLVDLVEKLADFV
ncbi:type I glyceraldehyde-3-phosphate dehydrogenase [Candidatus Roizmanbacteria bacterium RIFCSPHIGHO2_01_FULL_39_12b]|uniref:Type I glyceraldehyde-3-phosphate dehydrogenase n=1 Tax=Candidatus Roizmanbacteria bacterium RIFCSPHIGHO2_01_FULL_39_12b TaxID=1802030 RepID=A0A1F7GDX4_9BACT|nr:MAG: type I glyceraldehyde-3-phosphate dehydrogenase [Candidatus Roizmanbacteria bacterium RIFCSPHIGHO2_01_FULL_39_12b]OGK46060.1 MAG: type I glyceraldehyde-3-phosphate dehydrogenase [Candidatus Roizmanbacteria bacterium RIFCSPLOWO2_01_FULL_39_19]